MTKSTKSNQLELPSNLTTTSSKIRYLDSQKVPRGQIAKMLNIRYQHVRNVLITPVKNPK